MLPYAHGTFHEVEHLGQFRLHTAHHYCYLITRLYLDFMHIGYFFSGTYSITNDRVTLFEALSMAGDLNVTGRRDGVYVVREDKGQRVTSRVDLRSADVMKSPVFYLKQNDVIYVEPNDTKAGQSSINENSFKSASLWVSIASLLTSVAVLIWK